MKTVKNASTDPFFNLALEEWLMINSEDDIFMLWQNRPTVVIGRYQNAFAEVNLPYANENNIKVVRRNSGGGAVYHDLSNLNFSFIVKDAGSDIDFKRFLEYIVDALATLGVKAEISGRNDLEVSGRKISGNAQCRKYGKILHHGTLLYSADRETMSQVLSVDAEKIKSKGISSVKSRVGGLCEYTTADIETLKKVINDTIGGEELVLSDTQLSEVKALADSKFSSWDFVYGSSKSLQKTVKKRFECGTVQIDFSSDGGLITEISISGDFFAEGERSELEASLVGCRLNVDDLAREMSSSGCTLYGISHNDVAKLIMQ